MWAVRTAASVAQSGLVSVAVLWVTGTNPLSFVFLGFLVNVKVVRTGMRSRI